MILLSLLQSAAVPFMTLTLFMSTCQLFHRMSLNLSTSDIFFWLDQSYRFLASIPQKWCYASYHIISTWSWHILFAGDVTLDLLVRMISTGFLHWKCTNFPHRNKYKWYVYCTDTLRLYKYPIFLQTFTC